MVFAGPVIAATLTASSTPAASGRLVGCVSDTVGQRLPGVTVIAQRDGIAHKTVADRTGCFELTDLESGPYRVTAQLLGFDNATQDHVVVAPDTAARVDFRLNVSVVCECVEIPRPTTLSDAWQWADAVVRLRLSGPADDSLRSGNSHYYVHRATVLHVFKSQSAGGLDSATPIEVLEYQGNAAPVPYDPGTELVIFAKPADARTFVLGGCCGHTETAFVIEQGRIQAAPREFSDYVGKPIEFLLERVRDLTR